MAKYDNLAGTSETTFGIGPKALRALLRTALLSAARAFDLPDRDGTLSLDDPAFIRGFALESSGGSTVVIPAGAAYVQSVGRIVQYPGGSVGTGVTLGAQYHVYLTAAGGINVSTNVPNPTPYAGTARSMTGDTSQRWLGATYCGPTSSSLQNVKYDGGGNCVNVMFRSNTGTAPQRVISGGSGTTAADVSLAALAPPNATVGAHVRIGINTASITQIIRIYTFTGSVFAIYANQPALVANQLCGQTFYGIATDATPKLQYDVPSGGSTGFIDVLGYTFNR